jgi:hypothetical protein
MIYPASIREVAWLAQQTGLQFAPSWSAIAYERDDSLRAVALFQNWSGADIECTVAAIEAPRSFLRACARYAFRQLGCNRVTFKTKRTNHAAVSALGRLDAVHEGWQRQFYPDGSDAQLYAIHKSDFIHG